MESTYRWSFGSVPLNYDEWHIVETDNGAELRALCGFPLELEEQGAAWTSPGTFPRHDGCVEIYNDAHPGEPVELTEYGHG